jgi:hypothetical protein
MVASLVGLTAAAAVGSWEKELVGELDSMLFAYLGIVLVEKSVE